MKNKLHKSNTLCHAELDSASHSASNQFISNTDSCRKIKFPNFHILLFSMLYALCSIPATAQQYEWDWAVNGGGSLGESGWYYRVEQVFDIQVGTDNNYYFIAQIKNGSPKLGGQAVTVYGNQLGGNDIFIFSTTCDGQVRWSQAIGGGELFDAAYKIALDSSNNVYVGANVRNAVSTSYPVHFSPTDFLPPWPTNQSTIDAAYKTAYLIKYDTNGQFIWKKELQGDVNYYNKDSFIYDIEIDSGNNIHFIAGFLNGTHLDNTITVPATFTNAYQYYAVKFDTAGNYNSTLLPVTGHFAEPSFTFRYDEPRNRYLLGGFRSRVNANENIPLTYGGTTITENAYILAIDAGNGSEIWRREMESSEPVFQDNRIYDLVVDEANGDIYISGKLVATGQPGEYIRIKDPKNTSATPYTFNIAVWGNMPFVAKLNSSGTAQWARTPSGYNWSTAATGDYWGFGLALRYNEVAFATMGGNTIWDGFSINRPQGHQSDPLLMRFNKDTGAVIGMHDIEGSTGNNHMLTAVAVDNDGNYVVGGCYQGNLFTGGGKVGLLGAIGKYDFFVAKLAASTCGTAVSADKFNKITVNVYPNPTNDIINIETSETLQNYEVYNVLGQQIQKGMFGNNNQINLHGATAGTYFIKVTTAQGSTATVKVIKK